jgi:uncharacterized lipoprotein YddW (UPF0748 family)
MPRSFSHLRCLVALTFFIFAATTLLAQQKREIRGAWNQCVNGQYLGKTPAEIRQMLSQQLDVMQQAHINAIMFQVRAECDALYPSTLEPWSRYLTGEQGKAPADGWDPLAWMIEQCHARNMECHAWINPYRAKTKGTTQLAANHVARRAPNQVFAYDDLLILDPAQEANRLYTCMVVEDIIKRYDVDGIHMDDYFYPYPVAGIDIPDAAAYQLKGKGHASIEDWRRHQVDLLIQDLHRMIRKVKPWVKFGISPFGIYRNSPDGTNSERGSATSGLQNYDQLYAAVVLWQEKGWGDYLIPQIYWNIGTKAADYEVLCRWWNDYCSKRPLFIGQDVERTAKGADLTNPTQNQTHAKYALLSQLDHIQGTCQWYAAAFVDNPGNYRTLLQAYYFTQPALQPQMTFLSKAKPKKVRGVKIQLQNGRAVLTWQASKQKNEWKKATSYAVYAFRPGQKADIEHPQQILTITRDTHFVLPPSLHGYTLAVVALNRIHNESKPAILRL